MSYSVKALPPTQEIETKLVLKQLAVAHRHLAELKGIAESIPNESILINALAIQEAKDSSAVENIITTHDELYKSLLFDTLFSSAATKEVHRYAEALKVGFERVRKQRIISQQHILDIQSVLVANNEGYRKRSGTALVNERTGETVYTPPQEHEEIIQLMDNLVQFINDDSISSLDPLTKMALIHFQFESIHPFYDGNGRSGRILNILYLVQQDLLKIPILYLSRFIIERKNDYYRLLQNVRDKEDWESWILFMLEGIAQIAQETVALIGEIKRLMQSYKHRIREQLPKIYSQDLLNNLFKHPYTKIDFVMQELRVSRITATRYLNILVDAGFLLKHKISNSIFFINEPLFRLFQPTK